MRMGRPNPSRFKPTTTTSGSVRGHSFILILQFFLALLCISFFVQWWHWNASPLLSRNALHATADTNNEHVKLRKHREPVSSAPSGETRLSLENELFGEKDNQTPDARVQRQPIGHDLLDENNNNSEQIASTKSTILNSVKTPAPAVPSQVQNAKNLGTLKRFVPPTSSATPDEIASWRKRFEPSNHNANQKQVAKMLAWAWKGYEENAFGFDYLNVKTMRGDGLPGHDMAITLVDSLDTLFLFGMFEEFDKASAWVGQHMTSRIHQRGFISLFETTIRNMGGLLSAYYLSGHQHLLKAADELGAALSPAFSFYNHGIPGKDFDVVSKRPRESPSVAEVGSLQLEFKYLAVATEKQQYHDQVEHIMDHLFKEVETNHPSGLLPVQITSYDGAISRSSKITLGAYGDSYYEYLLKQWLLSGKKDEKYKSHYMRAVEGIRTKLLMKSQPSQLVFIGELLYDGLSPKMDHLVCFVPGMLALGYYHGMPQEHLELAKQLIETCYQMYARMATKLAPEIMYFHVDPKAHEDFNVHSQDAFNLQRPETVESLMILHRVTKDPKYRMYGLEIMKAFETNCRISNGGGYYTVGNVAKGPVRPRHTDGMESFFIAETLKYLFLLFSDDDTLLPLDEIVFNTEAHPFPMASSN